jgi:hypothetical protein
MSILKQYEISRLDYSSREEAKKKARDKWFSVEDSFSRDPLNDNLHDELNQVGEYLLALFNGDHTARNKFMGFID